jgi:hypothetical protein
LLKYFIFMLDMQLAGQNFTLKLLLL